MNYDVYIACRYGVGDGVVYQLTSCLEEKGYSVFVNLEEVDSRNFMKAAVQGIKKSKVFLLVAGCETFDFFYDVDDYVRMQVECAIEHNMPLLLAAEAGEFAGLPCDVPINLRNHLERCAMLSIARGEDATLMCENVRECLCNMITPQCREGVEYRLQSNLDCYVRVDGVSLCTLQAHRPKNVVLPTECATLEFVAIEQRGNRVRCVHKTNDEKSVNIDLLAVKQANEQRFGHILLHSFSIRKSGTRYICSGLSFGQNEYVVNSQGILDERFSVYFRISGYSEGRAIAQKNTDYYILDEDTNVIKHFPGGYVVSDYSEGLAACTDVYGKTSYVGIDGNEVIPSCGCRGGSFHEGLAMIGMCKIAFIDRKGNEVIPFKYFTSYNETHFQEGLAVVELNGKCGYIDKQGNEVIPCMYDRFGALPMCNGRALVRLKGLYGYIDSKGTEVTPMCYGRSGLFSNGLAMVCRGGLYGYIDHSGSEVIPCKYDATYPFSNGRAAVQMDGKWGFIDKRGIVVIPVMYDEVKSFSDGLACVKIDGRYGYIDRMGVVKIPCVFNEASSFNGHPYARPVGQRQSDVYLGLAHAVHPTEGIVAINKDGEIVDRMMC